MTNYLDRFTEPRLVLSVGCGFVTSLLQFTGKLDPAGTTYSVVIIATVGAFIGGDFMQKRSDNQTDVQKAQVAAQEQAP